MDRMVKLRRRAPAVALVVLLAGGALGLLAPYLSNVVNREMAIVVPSVSLAVDGVPTNASAGDVLTVLANLTNNANRPTPAVLRFEVRNPDGLGPAEITVHGVCGAEEIVSSKTLRYYIGSHGPLLAPNGTAFANGTRVSTVEAALGPRGHWEAVLAEVKQRDPLGYAALVEPGTSATEGIRGTSSLALRALFYYGMVQGDDPASKDPAKWSLKLPFASHVTIPVGSAGGFPGGDQPQRHRVLLPPPLDRAPRRTRGTEPSMEVRAPVSARKTKRRGAPRGTGREPGSPSGPNGPGGGQGNSSSSSWSRPSSRISRGTLAGALDPSPR